MDVLSYLKSELVEGRILQVCVVPASALYAEAGREAEDTGLPPFLCEPTHHCGGVADLAVNSRSQSPYPPEPLSAELSPPVRSASFCAAERRNGREWVVVFCLAPLLRHVTQIQSTSSRRGGRYALGVGHTRCA